MAIGTFEIKQEINSRARCEGYVAFQRGWFKTPPRVVVGITGFKLAGGIPSGLSVRVVEVTGEGMKWRIDGGGGQEGDSDRGRVFYCDRVGINMAMVPDM